MIDENRSHTEVQSESAPRNLIVTEEQRLSASRSDVTTEVQWLAALDQTSDAPGAWIRTWWSIPGLSHHIGLSQSWVRALITAGHLRVRNYGKGRYRLLRIDPASWDEYVGNK